MIQKNDMINIFMHQCYALKLTKTHQYTNFGLKFSIKWDGERDKLLCTFWSLLDCKTVKASDNIQTQNKFKCDYLHLKYIWMCCFQIRILTSCTQFP